MSRDALEKHDYETAKSYAVLADMYNKRVDGARDSELNQLRDEAGQIAEGLMSSANSKAGRKHYVAAMREYQQVSSLFSYTDEGETAKKKVEGIQQNLRGSDGAKLISDEAEEVFGEFMAYLMSSLKKSGTSAQNGGTVRAVDIVKGMSQAERKEVGEMINSIASLYGRTEYGQKALKLKRDLGSRGIRI